MVNSLGKVVERLMVSLVSILLGVYLVYLLVPSYGATGMALASMISKTTILILLTYVVIREVVRLKAAGA